MRIKPLLIFLVIFSVGFGAGFLVSGRLTKRSIEAVKERQSPEGFKKDLYKYLNPEESQKRIIDSIVADYIPKIKEERAESQRFQKHLRDSMLTQIQSLLDQKQQKRLEKFEREKIKITTTKSTDVRTDSSLKNRQKTPAQVRREAFREALPPEQRAKLDSVLNERKKERQNPELKREIRIYTRQNILPVLLQYRKEFEAELTEDEKQIIENVRAKRKLQKAEILEQALNGDNNETQEAKKLKNEMREQLKPILLNHKVYLESLSEKLASQRTVWESEMDVIKAKYIQDYKPNSDQIFKNKEKNALDFIMMNSERPFQKERKGRR
jgi:hypothetical protein